MTGSHDSGMNAAVSHDPAHIVAEGNQAMRAGRFLVSALGLLIFNLFMVIPAIVYGALLFALYASALALYMSGIAVTASGLAGVDEFMINTPFEHIIIESDTGTARGMQLGGRLNVAIRDNGIHIRHEDAGTEQRAAPVAAAATGAADVIDWPRTGRGIGVLFGGIALLLLSVLVTRITWIGLKRYAQMNMALLRAP